MNFKGLLYILFGNEKAIDLKLKATEEEFESLNLSSQYALLIQKRIASSKTKTKRLRRKLDLIFEYQYCINHHYELDVW